MHIARGRIINARQSKPGILEKFRIDLWMVAVAMFLSTSCASNVPMNPSADMLWKTAMPVPKFVSGVAPDAQTDTSSFEYLCVWINQSAVWEPGDEADNLFAHIKSSTQLVLDGQSMRLQNSDFFAFMTLSSRADSNGNPAGSNGGEAQVCIKPNLRSGLHVATIRLTTTSGKEYLYSWAFKISQ